MDRKRMRKKEMNNCKVHTGWIQEWISSNKVRRNKCIDVQEVVRGPFSSPRLIRTRPFVAFSSYRELSNENENNCDIRRGIPDTWRECLATKGFCGTAETNILRKNLIPSCIRCLATDKLWNDTGLPLIQGIPDPWKSRSLQNQLAKCSRRRHFRNKSASFTRIASIYDGDDETEIEYSVKCQFNKDCVNKKQPLQDAHGESNFPLIAQETRRIYEDNLEEAKASGREHISRLPLNKSSELMIGPKRPRKKIENKLHAEIEVKKTIDKGIIKISRHVREKKQLDKERQSSLKKNRDGSAIKIIKEEEIQTVPVVNETDPPIATPKKSTKQVQDSFAKTPIQVNAQMWPNTVCCNCILLQNHMISNTQYCPAFATSPLKDLSNRVLCQSCEYIRRRTNSQKLARSPKKLSFCTQDPRRYRKRKQMYRWMKLKLCACMRKAKERFGEKTNRLGHCTEMRSTIVSKQELKLMCYSCNSPYLRIKTIRANSPSNSRICSCVGKESSDRSKKKRNKTRERIVKYSTARKRSNIAGDSRKRYCTCIRNKRHVSRRDLERTSHSTTIKWRNDVAKKDGHKSLKTNGYDGNTSKMGNKNIRIDKVIRENIPNYNQNINNRIGNEKIIKNRQAQSNFNRSKQPFVEVKEKEGKSVILENDCCDSVNGAHGNSIIKSKENNIAQFQHPESDKALWYTISDSGEYADVSDNTSNVGFNVTDQDRSSVTSITFIQRLNDASPIRKLHRTKKLRRYCHFYCESSSETVTDFQQTLKIGDKIIRNKGLSNCSNRKCNCFSCTAGKKVRASMRPEKLIAARKPKVNKETLKYRIT